MTVESNAAIAGILERYLSGATSAPVTLMQLLIETEDFEAVRAIVLGMAREADERNMSAVAKARDAAGPQRRTESPRRAKELVELMLANAAGCERIAAMLRADVDSAKPAQSVEEGIAFSERLFDWSVQQSEEASVALYSLGNPALLERATAEIVSQLDAWGLVTSESEVLDIGCGTGRLLLALAPRVRSVTGIDVSSEMVKVARGKCAAYPNVTVLKGHGRGLAGVSDDLFDTAIAVDSFPYLRQSGYALVEQFVADSARVLKPGGQLVILNYSYNENDHQDATEVRNLAIANGFEVLESGSRPFELWDGLAFRLKKVDV